MKKDWNGIMKILWIEQTSKDGEIKWKAENLYNILHLEGENFILDVVFGTLVRPTFYYLGLDNRSTISPNDTITSLLFEPNFGGYIRQSVATFTLSFVTHYIAESPIVSFKADSFGPGWGPVSNLFLTNKPDSSGKLIATSALGSTLTVEPGDSITMKMKLSMKDCP